MKYRIMKDGRGYYVQRKGWFFWRTEKYTDSFSLPTLFGMLEINKYFDSEEKAAEFIKELESFSKPSVVVKEIEL